MLRPRRSFFASSLILNRHRFNFTPSRIFFLISFFLWFSSISFGLTPLFYLLSTFSFSIPFALGYGNTVSGLTENCINSEVVGLLPIDYQLDFLNFFTTRSYGFRIVKWAVSYRGTYKISLSIYSYQKAIRLLVMF